MLKIRTGIIGSGRMGERHANACSFIRSADVVGFADVDSGKSELLARKFHKKSYSIQEMLEDDSIDTIHVCTTNQSHAENSIAALRSGKHVLVEKPMATTLYDCDRMISAAEKSHLNLMVGHTYRFYPSSLKVKQILDGGNIGSIKAVIDYAVDPGQIPGQKKTPHWLLSKRHGGGILFDVIHSVDKLRFWLKSEVVSAYVPLIYSDRHSNIEKISLALLNFSNGVSASIMPVAQITRVRDVGTKIIGTKGVLYTRYGEEVKVGKSNWKNYRFDHMAKNASYLHNLQGFINEISEFILSIKNKRQPMITGQEGKKNLEVVLCMYESYKKKKIVSIV